MITIGQMLLIIIITDAPLLIRELQLRRQWLLASLHLSWR